MYTIAEMLCCVSNSNLVLCLIALSAVEIWMLLNIEVLFSWLGSCSTDFFEAMTAYGLLTHGPSAVHLLSTIRSLHVRARLGGAILNPCGMYKAICCGVCQLAEVLHHA